MHLATLFPRYSLGNDLKILLLSFVVSEATVATTA